MSTVDKTEKLEEFKKSIEAMLNCRDYDVDFEIKDFIFKNVDELKEHFDKL